MAQTEDPSPDLPGFSQPPTMPGADPLDPSVTTMGQTGAPDRPKVSGEPSDLGGVDRPHQNESSTSSTVSSAEIEDALGGYGETGFYLATVGINKLVEARTEKKTGRWLATQDEAERVGAAVGRIANRRVPDKLTENPDAADYLVIGEVVAGYAVRTIFNLTPAEMAEQAREWIEADAQPPGPSPANGPQQGAPPPTAPPPRAPAPPPPPEGQETPGPAGVVGVVAATPAPPSVISMGI